MFKVKRFREGPDIYHYDWEKNLPESITIIDDDRKIRFKRGNVMMHFDMVQCTYEASNWGFPDTLEFDFYFLKPIGSHYKIDIDITLGDDMVCEFSISVPDKVDVIHYTSWRSKSDPTNTVFALDDLSLKKFVNFLNRFDGFSLKVENFKFLDKNDNFKPD